MGGRHLARVSRAANRVMNEIGDFEIGAGRPPYVIAEIGFNHEGDLDLALAMIDAAAEAGAQAAKFQTYRAANLVLDSVEHFNVIRHGELDREAHRRLADHAAARGIHFMSTPYDLDCVDLLIELGVPALKVASMDLTNHPLLAHAARTGLPLIVSTGMAIESEIEEAIGVMRSAGCDQIVLLHCMSKYPADPAHANLATIPHLARRFGLPVGWSDHVLGNEVAFAATALGACVIEKHFTTDKHLPGPDHRISADPAEMAALVAGSRAVCAALGTARADDDRPDRPESRLYRRGLFARRPIAAGETITPEMVACVRPEAILAPKDEGLVIGRRARVAIDKNQALGLELLDGDRG